MLGLRAVCTAIRGRMPEARAEFESAERLLKLSGPSRTLAIVQQNLGNLCNMVGDYETAPVGAGRRRRTLAPGRR